MSALYTPDTLADRWGCSGKTVRLLIEAGKLRAFRVGERLIRIPAEAVEEYECRPNENGRRKNVPLGSVEPMGNV